MSSGRVAFGPTEFSARQNTAWMQALLPNLAITHIAPRIAAAPPHSRFMPGIIVYSKIIDNTKYKIIECIYHTE